MDSISADSSDAENDDDAGYYGDHAHAHHHEGHASGERPPPDAAPPGISPGDMMGLRSKESEAEEERPPSSSGVSSRKTSAESVTSSG